MNSDEPIKIDLAPAEQDLLVQGLAQWGGPASPTDELARAIGFRSRQDRLGAIVITVRAVARSRNSADNIPEVCLRKFLARYRHAA